MLANFPLNAAWARRKLRLIEQHRQGWNVYTTELIAFWQALEQRYRREQADLDSDLFDWTRQLALIRSRTLLIRAWKQEKATSRDVLLIRQAEELATLNQEQ